MPRDFALECSAIWLWFIWVKPGGPAEGAWNNAVQGATPTPLALPLPQLPRLLLIPAPFADTQSGLAVTFSLRAAMHPSAAAAEGAGAAAAPAPTASRSGTRSCAYLNVGSTRRAAASMIRVARTRFRCQHHFLGSNSCGGPAASHAAAPKGAAQAQHLRQQPETAAVAHGLPLAVIVAVREGTGEGLNGKKQLRCSKASSSLVVATTQSVTCSHVSRLPMAQPACSKHAARFRAFSLKPLVNISF